MVRFARGAGSKGSNEKAPEEATNWQDMKSSMLQSQVKSNITPIEEEVDVPTKQEIETVWADLVAESAPKKRKKLKVKNSNTDSNEEVVVKKKKVAKNKTIVDDSIIELPKKKSSKKKTDAPNTKKDLKLKKKKHCAANDTDDSVKQQIKIGTSESSNSKEIQAQKPREKKRKKAALQETQVFINGKPVSISPFDGFPVLTEDLDRLRQLRKSLKEKGVSRVEREKIMKLERRRAEKALQRLKRQVCFQCRGSGHVLSECPQIQKDEGVTGICYKCGSTEHTHYQCRVSRGEDFRFAECFICKEHGHIAKQCPDNPRGLYPRGGACAVCGDVTHLKKDCPKYVSQQQEEKFTVGTRDNTALEALDEDVTFQKATVPAGPSRKHIKFS